MAGKQSWTEALQLHESAVAQFAQAAEAIPPELWSTPRAEGKWSAAQITEHLILAYEVLLQELSGGAGMQIRTRWWQRLLLRFTLVPRLLAGGAFPVARAPRETRPAAEPEAQPLLVARFRSHAASFQAAAEAARARNRRQRLTHAYFGAASVEEGVVLCARHILHHQQQLSGIAVPQATST